MIPKRVYVFALQKLWLLDVTPQCSNPAAPKVYPVCRRNKISPSVSLQCIYLLRIAPQGFPGGAVVENLPANAGDTGSSPGLGRSHMPQRSQAREPQLLGLRVCSLCSATREAATVRGPHTAMKSGPRLPQLEEALAQKKRPNTAKNKLIN